MCLSVSLSLHLVHFGQVLRYVDKCIVNLMKVYIGMNNLQVELIRIRKTNVYCIRVYLCEGRDAMLYRPAI